MIAKRIKGTICIAVCIVVALVFILHFLCYSIVADPIGLRLQSVEVSERYITISGFNYGGVYNYRSYTTQYNDGVLCIKYRGGFDLPWIEGRNSPDFCPVFNKFEDLTEIYLSSGSDDKRRLIWSQSDGEILEQGSL